MEKRRVVVVGGGAAGFFGAIACAEARPECDVLILERGARFLDKVRISGGGRCNVTHAGLDIRDFAERYPRGGKAMLGLLKTFSANDAVEWYEARGVPLKAEADGRMFPTTDSSQTIIDCLTRSAAAAGVRIQTCCGVQGISRLPAGGFDLALSTGESLRCDAVLLATGGCRSEAAGQLAVSLGHSLMRPAPSLFSFEINSDSLRSLAGISLARAEVSAPAVKLRESGPLLVTHSGLSGPAVLRLSAWGAPAFFDLGYRFTLNVNWLPGHSPETVASEFQTRRQEIGARLVSRQPLAPVPGRLWEYLVAAAGLPSETRWASMTRPQAQALTQQLLRMELAVSGKSLNKDEFVTCGGIPLSEVNLKTLESRVAPGLHFAGELLDIDGVTGGFNFQAAWTSGFIAGRAMAGVPSRPQTTHLAAGKSPLR